MAENVLLEFPNEDLAAFNAFAAAALPSVTGSPLYERLLDEVRDLDIRILRDFQGVPMFTESIQDVVGFGPMNLSAEHTSKSIVYEAEILPESRDMLANRGIKIWPNSTLSLLEDNFGWPASVHRASECAPFQSSVDLDEIRRLLSVEAVYSQGFRGQNICVGILDQGIDGNVYPVTGGSAPLGGPEPGHGSIQSHGSMCAADVLVAAPTAKLYDYPFMVHARSGGAIAMFQAALGQYRNNGTPQILSNSWGFYTYPDRTAQPNHEVWDLDHPLHRKIREVVSAGIAVFFAAGNCGADCPDGRCAPSATGPGRSINSSNSLTEVITVAAVNARNQRLGYSSQGSGMFDPQKPDIAAYSHFFGNYGLGRPAGNSTRAFDSGTSAATPLVAGVAALLYSAFDITSAELRTALTRTATSVGSPGWNRDYGYGIINAGAAYHYLRSRSSPARLN